MELIILACIGTAALLVWELCCYQPPLRTA
jgi:hypothetical protein